MSVLDDQKALDDIEETLKQTQLEKTNLLEHLYREEKKQLIVQRLNLIKKID